MKIERYTLADNVPFGRFASATTEYGLDRLAPTEQADKVAIWITSTLNQAVTLQVIGNEADSGTDLTDPEDIEVAALLASGATTAQRMMFTVNTRDYWVPFAGLTVLTGATAPTAGRLTVTVRTGVPETDSLLQRLLKFFMPDRLLGRGRPVFAEGEEV